MEDTNNKILNKTALLFLLIAAFAAPAFGGEGTTYFKSDLAGKDLFVSKAPYKRYHWLVLKNPEG